LVEISNVNIFLENLQNRSPLSSSIFYGQLEIFRYLFNFVKIIPIDVLFQVLDSPNMVEEQKLQFIKFILEHNIQTDIKYFKNGESFLHLCAYGGKKQILDYVLNFVDVDFPDHIGNSILTYVIASIEMSDDSKIELLNFLILEKGANPHFENLEKVTPFYASIIIGNIKLMDYFVKNFNGSLDLHDTESHDSLMEVIRSERINKEDDKLVLIKYLIQSANAQVQMNENVDTTALHMATHQGFIKITEFLLDNINLTLNSKDSYGITPFMSLVVSENIEEAEKLNFVKYFIDVVDISQIETILFTCLFNGYTKLALFFLENTNIDIKNLYRQGSSVLNALIPASNEVYQKDISKFDLFKILVETYKANIYNINHFGETILHNCVYFGELEILQYLLEKKKN